MHAAYIEQPGPPENIRYGELPTPKPGPGEVLVRVGAVAVNPIDTYIRNGANYWPLPQPYIVGCDLAGTVEQCGPGATRLTPGDRVWGSNQGLLGRQGTFAEYCVVDEDWLYPTPPGVSDEEAAAGALVGITAHLGLFRVARLAADESLCVVGGTGGVGSMVVQMAKARGARVLTTAGDDAKAELAVRLGADRVVHYKTEDVAAAIQEFSPGGVNVFWETRREPDFDFIVSCVGPRGRILLMAGRDARPPFPVGPFYVKECSLHGFVMFKATPEEQRRCADDINRWLVEGRLRPNIGRVMHLSEAAAAHRLQQESTVDKSGALCGKIVLKP